jgi:tetratricopeptide (TPR) repeat protein
MIARRVFRDGLVILVVLLILPCALAQQPSAGGGAKGGGTGSGSKGGDNVNVPPTPPKPPSGSNAPDQSTLIAPHLLFIRGVVIMEDGSPVPSGAVIERSCQGKVIRESYVSLDGTFSFQLGGDHVGSQVLPDAADEDSDVTLRGGPATEPWGIGNTAFPDARLGDRMPFCLAGCEIRAQLDGYRSSYVTLDGSVWAGIIDAGTILLAPIARVKGSMVSATNLHAPKSARKALEKAEDSLKKSKFNEAERKLGEAIRIYPEYAAAFTSMGDLYRATNRLPEAREAYEKAISLDDKYVTPYISLARLVGMDRKWQETAELTDRALLLDPIDFPEGYYLNSVAHFNLKNFEAAERSARKLKVLDPKHKMPQVFIILAYILERKQDVLGAMEQLEQYLSAAPEAPDIAEVRAHLDKLHQSSKPVAQKFPVSQSKEEP